jgi:hypothetical protein
MGSYAEAIADFDAIVNDPNATEKVDKNLFCYFFIVEILDENECRIKTSEYKNSST